MVQESWLDTICIDSIKKTPIFWDSGGAERRLEPHCPRTAGGYPAEEDGGEAFETSVRRRS